MLWHASPVFRRSVVLMATLLAGFASPARGQLTSSDDREKPVRLTIHPQGEPLPALKYQLLPTMLERRPGNAAVDYGKVTAEQPSFFKEEFWEFANELWNAPLAEFKKPEVRERLDLNVVFDTLDRAARRESIDWQLPIREQPFYSILLPELQQTRSFGRLLAARARMQIADGRYDDAVETLKTGYALSRHVAAGPTLIHALVGMAIADMMDRQIEDLIQQPGAPNLYWALAALPRPFIDIRGGMEAEKSALYFSYPMFQDLERTDRGKEYWADALQEFWREFLKLSDSDADSFVGEPVVVAALSLKGYPRAKQVLVEHGFSPEEVEAMPAPQVILLASIRVYEQLRDDHFKWFYVPYGQHGDGLRQAEEQLNRYREQQLEIIPIASMLLPALSAVRSTTVRSDRQITALQAVEAIRMHAARTGKLPGALGEVAPPVPFDPVTGKPFEYRLEGDTAHLEGPVLRDRPLRVEITLAR